MVARDTFMKKEKVKNNDNTHRKHTQTQIFSFSLIFQSDLIRASLVVSGKEWASLKLGPLDSLGSGLRNLAQ